MLQPNPQTATERASTAVAPAQTHLKPAAPPTGAVASFRAHWPEYAMEAALLGAFMVSACAFSVLYFYPGSPVRQAIESPELRRVLMGSCMGLTAIAIIYSPWGKQSGAHINPATTLTFLRLGKVRAWDAAFYIAAQFVGGVAGVVLVLTILQAQVSHPTVRYVATVPGIRGPWVAFAAEFVITFLLMTTVLVFTNRSQLASRTGIAVGCLVALFISFEEPLSGMSMNPARTFGSALPGQVWNSLWVYFTAPPLGMLAAAQFYQWRKGRNNVVCAKLHHTNERRCIFCGANGGFTS